MSLMALTGCDFANKLEQKAAKVNRFESASLTLAKENRLLSAEIGELKAEIETLKSRNNYLQLQLDKTKGVDRGPASIRPVDESNDLVNQQTYKWTPSQLVAMAQKEFDQKNYLKSAQYFQTLLTQYPEHEAVKDTVLFQAGVASYESGKYDKWVLTNLEKLVTKYPTSKHYRSAKLWIGLTHLKLGDQDSFFKTVEEFRKKYRNTSEWEILSAHYEKILQKYKK